MILPIYAYGDSVLRKVCNEIDENYPGLNKLISDMFDTMYNADGIGLAAPQIGKDIRLFVIDASPVGEGDDGDPTCVDFKRVFINPVVIEESGEDWECEEGCLSIPKLREKVTRKSKVLVEYYDENWDLFEEELEGFAARVFQHEYDHIEGKLFTDRISAFRRTLLKGKLSDITNGNISVRYKMKFPK
jgi:peptide deformylase